MELSVEQSKTAEEAKEVLEKFLELLELPGEVTFTSGYFPKTENEDNETIALNIEGEDLGLLIGRRGQTLISLQLLVRIIVTQKIGSELPVIIDVEGYRLRRCENLRDLAQRIAEQVKIRKVPFALEPMSSFDRRVVHLELINSPDVTTQSTGFGEMRKVMVLPRDWVA